MEEAIRILVVDDEPVSYTHLDVYKRQVQAARPGLPHQRLYYILNPYQHHPCTVFVQMVLILCYLFSIIAL